MRPSSSATTRLIDLEKTVGQRVRALREARGLSQAQLGHQLGKYDLAMEQPTIYKLEKGLRPIRLNELAALAAFFDVPLDQLCRLDEGADEELSRADARVFATRSREAAARRAAEDAAEAAKVAAEAAAFAQSRLEDVWAEQQAAMAVYEHVLKTRKAPRHG